MSGVKLKVKRRLRSDSMLAERSPLSFIFFLLSKMSVKSDQV